MTRFLHKTDNRGLTLVELLSVMVVITILAAVAMPMYKVSVKRAKEYELKRSLRDMRDAIDQYKRWVDNGWISKITESGYPPSLDVLVEGVEVANRAVAASATTGYRWNPTGQLPPKIKFLRKIPVDPMTGNADWGQKGNEDVATGSIIGSNKDVFDVYSKSDGEALDGTYYKDW